MIVWGSGGSTINLGPLDTRRCDICEKDRPFDVILQYRYWGLYWIFNFMTQKKYLLLCDVCERGWELEANKIESSLKSAPIPFMRRYGLLTLVGIVVLLVIVRQFGAG